MHVPRNLSHPPMIVRLQFDLDDVQRVTANFDLPAEVLAEVAGV